MAARRRRAAANDSQLSLDFLFGGDPTTQGPLAEAAGTDRGAGDEPLRRAGDAALADPSADPVRPDHGPDDVLHRARGAGGGPGRGADLQLTGDDPPADPGEPASFLDKAARINTAKRMAEERILPGADPAALGGRTGDRAGDRSGDRLGDGADAALTARGDGASAPFRRG